MLLQEAFCVLSSHYRSASFFFFFLHSSFSASFFVIFFLHSIQSFFFLFFLLSLSPSTLSFSSSSSPPFCSTFFQFLSLGCSLFYLSSISMKKNQDSLSIYGKKRD
ncbi:hypothetical protein RIF29_25728 [Crotalaria pallida]|uniref:Uncharacterized protein n=1 Tax=Crotalaria pallida TaxID=3830 RepID=A0AAN9EMT9_CROPI